MLPANNELYDMLDVSPDSHPTAIRAAYLKKCKELHPDKNPNINSDMMQKLTEAKTILLDHELKKRYDQKGLSNVMAYMSSTEKFKRDREKVSCIQLRTSTYDNVYIDYNCTLKDMYLGIERSITYKIKIICKYCTKVDLNPELTDKSYNSEVKDNDSCKLKCKNCQDRGYFENTRKRTVQIFNADDGETITDKGFGNELHDTHTDLVIVIQHEPEPYFKKSHSDIIMEMTITLRESLFGFTKVFKYIDDLYYKIINENGVISHGDFRVIKSMGLKSKHSFLRGNLIIIFFVEMPSRLTDLSSVSQIVSALPHTLNSNYDPEASRVMMMLLTK
ncbi:hypothetical protein HZS_367 [Henneguya salminicola]|nr:hypothetical protein HZS_367 [Henneguya salminicola]